MEKKQLANSPSAPSPSSVCSMNTDGNIQLYGSSTVGSPLSSSMSPISSSDSSSVYSFQHLQIAPTANDYHGLTSDIRISMDKPCLVITEQPIDKFRFRYKSEMHGTHGSLTGQNASRTKKTFPSVRLYNVHGEALVRCSLYQIPKPGHDSPSPHSHSLVIRCGNEDRKDPHEVTVSQMQGYTATFQGMGIIHTARKFIEDELFDKLVSQTEFEFGRELSALEKEKLRQKAKKEATDMNLNQVSLCFDAYQRINGQYTRICPPVFSNPINNMKSALTGELKISRLSSVVGGAAGNDDLFLFVEKVGKKNIKVRFFEIDEDNYPIWEDWGKFTEADVHHQYAIALKTPPYRITEITDSVTVFIQLFRPNDEAVSEPVEFRYKPSFGSYGANGSRKRPRVTSSMYEPVEIPSVISNFPANAQPSFSLQASENCAENDIEVMIEELLDGPISADAPSLESYTSEDLRTFLQTFSDVDKLQVDAASTEPQTNSKDGQLMMLFSKIIDIDGESNAKRARKFLGRLLRKFRPNGESLLHVCARSDNDAVITDLWQILHKFQLYDFLQLRNDSNETCLHVAATLNKADLVRNLLRFGSDVNSVDFKGDTALHVAVLNGSNDCIDALLNTNTNEWKQEIYVDVNVLNDDGYAPLHLAAKTNNVTAIRMLNAKAIAIEKSIFDVVEAKHGNSALHIAIESVARNVVEYILQTKCISPIKVNQSGHTALYLARASQANELLELMQKNSSIDLNKITDDVDDDGSSKDSVDSIEAKISSSEASVVRPTTSSKNFDDCCFTELSDIFNKGAKWNKVAIALGYKDYIQSWQKLRNPTKALLIFSESLKVPKDKLLDVFKSLGESEAVECVNKWKKKL